MAKGHARHRGGNRWQLEVDLGSYVDPATGKRKRNRKYKTIKAKSQNEANIELAKFVVKVTDSDYYEPEKTNFIDFVQHDWLPVAKDRLAHTTLSNYLSQLELRILPAFQYLKIDQVRTKHIVDFLRNLREDGIRVDGKKGGLSDSTIRNYYRCLDHIFSYACELRIIKDNPTDGITIPKRTVKEIKVYTVEEARELLTALESETHVPHWQIIVKLSILTGMRKSELYGLEFKHFDFEKKTLSIEQALTYSTEQGYQIHPIKKGGKDGSRIVSLSPNLIEPVKKLKKARKEERFAFKKEDMWRGGKYNFILSHSNGRPFNPWSMQNWWERFIKRHGLKYTNIHALRHTSATLLINQGVHAKVISDRLGHSNISTTMDIYGHVLKEADERSTELLDEALKRNSKGTI